MFTAGHVEFSQIKDINLDIYNIAKEELDSSSIKISTKKTKYGVNYVAFLIKADIQKESILTEIDTCIDKKVISFELEYKKYGVICENGIIIDYLLDNPEEYASFNDLELKEISNQNGLFLMKFNLSKEKKKFKLSLFLLIAFLIIFVVLLVLAFFYIDNYSKTIKAKNHILDTYEKSVSANFKSLKMLRYKDSMSIVLDEVESICQDLGILLKQVDMRSGSIFITFEEKDIEELEANLGKNYKFIKKDNGGLIYKYEKL
jgi:hypothetical protein